MTTTLLTLSIVALAKVSIWLFGELIRADADTYRQSSVDL